MRRRQIWGLATILGLGLLLRVLYVLALHSTPAGRFLLIDSAFYAARARDIAAGLGWGPETYFMNPLYPYLLAPLRPWLPHGPLVVGLVQSVLGTITVILIAWLARCWFGPRTVWVALPVAALYGPAWFYDGAVLTATPILLSSAVMLWSLERWRVAGRPSWAIVAGVSAGVAMLLRPNMLLFLCLLPVLIGIGRVARDGAPDRRRLVRVTLLIWVCAALVAAPAVVRNQVVAGEPVLTTGLGMNFYTGNQPGATGIYDGAPFVTSYEPDFERADFEREAARRLGRPLSASASSRFWLGEAWRGIIADPGAWFRLELRKLRLMLHHVEAQNNLSIYIVRDWVPLLDRNPIGFRLLAPFAVLGLALHLRRYRELALPLGFLVAQILTMLLFFVSSEYRLPAVVVLIPAAAAGAVALADRIRGRPVAHLRLGLILCVLAAIVGSSESAMTRRLTSKRVDYLNFATLAEAAGEAQTALELLSRSLTIDPEFVPALERQRALATRLGLDAVAAAAGEKLAALPAAPVPIQLWDVDRAVALYREERYAEALDVFRRLAHRRPAEARLLNNMGLCLYKLERYDEAERLLRQALALEPSYARARHNLALVARAIGHRRSAIAELRVLLAQEPRHWRSRLKLVDWALDDGNPAAARREIDSLVVLGADPMIIERARTRLQAAGSDPSPRTGDR